jgi:hypothetical protein
MSFLLRKSLKLKLANKASDLLVKIMDEPFSENLTETEEEFKGVIISLSKISPAYKHLSDSYMRLYQHIMDEKKK